MDTKLLKTLIKFSSVVNVANTLAGSPAYTLGAGGDVKDVPATEVVKHSIIPNLVRIGIGSGLGYAVGNTATNMMDDYGVSNAVGPTTSNVLHWAIPAASTAAGGAIAQSMGQKQDFMQAIRDRTKAV
jgi:hypothetical protein